MILTAAPALFSPTLLGPPSSPVGRAADQFRLVFVEVRVVLERVSGLVAYWRPAGGERHALEPTQAPREGQERVTLCGETITVVEASDVAWLSPTCDFCWAEATSRSRR